jgi:hypothetical protein
MKQRRRSQHVRVVYMLLVLLIGLVAIPAHAQDERCFSETQHCIAGRFLRYWEQNGGLAVFGYPITPARDEINGDTGQPYLTQWFERNRFELHPDQAAPYDVQLGRLGDDRLRQRQIDWRSLPREAGPRPGCLWFEQTGHNVCDQDEAASRTAGFKTYWQTHGLQDPALDGYARSLALFGLPLSEARVETNTSGDSVLTQWFERARLEWHPANAPEYRVLLGLLGNQVQRAEGVVGEPQIMDVGVSAATIPAGGTLTLSYTIYSPRAERVTLGASLRPSGAADWYADTPNDTIVILKIGTNDVSRPFVVRTGNRGSHDVAWGVWQAESGTSYGYVERGGVVTVVAPTTSALYP